LRGTRRAGSGAGAWGGGATLVSFGSRETTCDLMSLFEKTIMASRVLVKTVSISTLKASLSEFLDVVRKGHEVIITDRGRPVARLLPVEGDTARDELRARLIREGVLSPPRRGRSRKLVPPSGKRSSGLVAALIEERGEGR